MEVLTYECIAISNYIIEKINKYNEGKALREQIPLTTKRLQKLLYFCDIEYMKYNNGLPLFKDLFYAWPSGPVIPDIYYYFMQYQDGKMFPKYPKNSKNITDEIKSLIDYVLYATENLDTIDLVMMTKMENGPYYKVYDESNIEYNEVINKQDMYHFYKTREIIIENDRIKSKKLSKNINNT